jgi:arylsulfatase A-like enzyme
MCARLASTYTRGYVPSSLCRPSLASILTGLYPHEHFITGNDPPGEARDSANRARMTALFAPRKTIAGELSEAGYVSHQSGKWWEGECNCCGFTQCMSHGDVTRGGRHGDVGLEIGRKTMRPVFDFIDAAAGKPFLLWYAPMMPHTPHNPPERLLGKYAHLPPAKAKYFAMIEWFDETVGQLVDYIEAKGMAENTLFVYVADNGWVQLEGQRSLHATRAKMSPYDAGLRTPVILRWKGRIAPRREENALVSSIDIAPTVLRAAGVRVPAQMHGVDLAAGKGRTKVFGANFAHTSVDLERPAANLKYRWMVDGNWKLIVPYAPNRGVPLWENFAEKMWGEETELYDLSADPGEESNLAPDRRAIVERLTKELDRWWQPKP